MDQNNFRISAKECRLDEIVESDSRVCVIVNLISLNKAALEGLISDSSFEARVFFKEAKEIADLHENKVYRIIGKPFFNDSALQLNCEVIQLFDNSNLMLYKKLLALEKK